MAASDAIRSELVTKVKALAGDTTADRFSLYNSLLPFLNDFGNAGNGSGVTENDRIEYIYSEVSNGRIAWPIPSLMSWISYYHDEDAKAFYRVTGLIANHGIVYQAFDGHPGEWAAERVRNARSSIAQSDSYRMPLRKVRGDDGGNRHAERRNTRSDISSDSLRISKNKLYLKELINIVTAIARDSGMSSKELMKEIDQSMTSYGLRGINARSRPTKEPMSYGRKITSRRVGSPRMDMHSPAFVSGAICWLSSKYPAKLASFYEAKNMNYLTSRAALGG